eukprot:11950160-Heterocapsa_arctica.AAC.1
MQDSDGKKDDKGKGGGGKGLMRMGFLDEAAVFAGARRDNGDAMVCPLLLEDVAKEVERDASVLKQVRKACEERSAMKSDSSKKG